eukprot:TRINITY_DN4679_c0_g1_i1.p1 TRINITY_DN4679_c0_g1~~TRINITY_DN4679_c0_g1_i1.p1  ORF type:complete len:1360 (+),score=312.03 TRINITY_DN4679_c0_g1_i1:321-4400(+)
MKKNTTTGKQQTPPDHHEPQQQSTQQPSLKRQRLLQDDSRTTTTTTLATVTAVEPSKSNDEISSRKGPFVPSHWCFAGVDTEMSRFASSFNWSATRLGPVESWPPSVWYAFSILMNSRFPMLLWIGEDFNLVYNDAYAPVIGKRHLKMFGSPGREVFFEIWGTIGEQLKSVHRTKIATWSVDQQLIMLRHGYLEETYWTYSYSPVLSAETTNNPNAKLEAVFTAVEDTTVRYLSERRLRTLRDLSAQATQAKSQIEVCEQGMNVLSTNPYDIPFAGCYLLSDNSDRTTSLTLASSYGLSTSSNAHRVFPSKVSLAGSSDQQEEPISQIIRTTHLTKEHQILDISNYGIGAIPPWNDEPRYVVVLPLTTNNRTSSSYCSSNNNGTNSNNSSASSSTDGVDSDVVDTFGVLVVGVNSRRELDDPYLTFFKLVAAQTTGSLNTAHRHEEAKRKADALAELDRAKTLFFTNISHELRTPLTLMLGPIEELLYDNKNEAVFGKDNMDKLHLLHRNARRLLKLVNVLLDFSRIEAGRMQATYQPVDLSRLTADLASVFRSACEKARISLEVDCPALVSSTPPYVDSNMWEKIVLNLLSNAFKFTLEGGITVKLHESYKPEFGAINGGGPSNNESANSVVLSIADTGCGIPEHEMPRLFERFHRVQGNNRGRSFEGSGIGLALVYELVKLHGGLIECKSKEGAGTQFSVTIPLGKSHLTSAMGRILDEPLIISSGETSEAKGHSRRIDWLLAESSSNGGSNNGDDDSHSRMEDDVEEAVTNASSGKTRSKKNTLILVVDDNADMLNYVTRILQDRHQVIQATDGEMALALLRDLKRPGHRLPDLVLSDVMMPKIDGFELLKLMQADLELREIPIVFLSARAGEEAHSEGISVGADDYLIKPFSAKELLARVHARIELSKFRLAATRQEQLLRKAAEDANNAKDKFLAMLSHELRTPLTPVLLLAEENMLNKNLSDRVREDLAMIARNVRLETQLIDDLLDLTKISQHKLQLHLQPVDAHVVLRQAVELVRCNIEEKKLHLDLTEICGEKRLVVADPVRLQQVFWNLLGNASKFTPSGGKIQVKTFTTTDTLDSLQTTDENTAVTKMAMEREGDEPDERNKMDEGENEEKNWLHVIVKDSGIGIDPVLLPKLFTAFEQGGDAITQQFGGLGLGLNISKALVTMHGGKLSAFSEGKNMGATFEVKIPLASAPAVQSLTDDQSVMESSSSSSSPETQQPLHILLVEDNQMTCSVMVRYLSTRLGHIVSTAHTRTTAEETLRKAGKEFDLIFCDIGLPDGTGFDVMKVIQELQPHSSTPVIALTGYGSDGDIEQTHKAGFSTHMTKPIQLAQIDNVLHKYGRSKRSRELR